MVERKEAKLLPEVPMSFTAGAMGTAAVIINEHSLGARLLYTLILVMTHHPSSQPAETVTVVIPQFMDRRVEITKPRSEPGSLFHIMLLNQ